MDACLRDEGPIQPANSAQQFSVASVPPMLNWVTYDTISIGIDRKKLYPF